MASLLRVQYLIEGSSTFVVLDLDRMVHYRSGGLSNPARFYIDLDQTLVSVQLTPDELEVKSSALKGIRIAQNQPGVARVVLDLNKVQGLDIFWGEDNVQLVVELTGSQTALRKRSGSTQQLSLAAVGQQSWAQLTQVSLEGEGEVIGLTLKLDQAVQYRAGFLPDPPRVYVDLLGTRIAPSLRRKPIGAVGPIRRVRLDHNQLTVTRVVLDLDRQLSYQIRPPEPSSELFLEIDNPNIGAAQSSPQVLLSPTAGPVSPNLSQQQKSGRGPAIENLLSSTTEQREIQPESRRANLAEAMVSTEPRLVNAESDNTIIERYPAAAVFPTLKFFSTTPPPKNSAVGPEWPAPNPGEVGSSIDFAPPPISPGGDADESGIKPILLDEIVARINSEVITLTDIQQEQGLLREDMEAEVPDIEGREARIKEASRYLLPRMIDQQLMLQRAEEMGMTADIEVDVASYIEAQRRQMGVANLEIFERVLNRQGLSMSQYRTRVREQILASRVMNQSIAAVTVMEADVQAYYQDHLDRFRQPAELELAEILISLEEEGSEDLRQIAEEVHALARQGSPFEELAHRYSSGPTATEGGRLGMFQQGTLHESIRPIIDKLDSGQVSQVLDDPLGYRIYKVLSRRSAGPRPLDAVREEIVQLVYQEKVRKRRLEFLKKLREENYVYIAPKYRELFEVEGYP